MGIFASIKNFLGKTRDNLGRKIFEVFKAKALDDEFYEELEAALISADVGVTATENIIEELKDAIYRKKITSPEQAKKELKRIMLESIDYEIPPYDYPLVILVAGVNGVGKTTAIGKLAKLFVSEGKSVIVAAADTFRAAASEQLEIWAQRAGVRLVKHGEGSDPAAVVFDAISSAKAHNTEVILVDTAGRLHNKKNLMEELKKINRVIQRELPDADQRNYIVLDATTGQNAVSQVDIFNEAIDIDGIILTKMDGTAKGGVVLAISAELEIPVVYAGIGEKIDDIIPFNAEEFIDAIFS
ncbi:MAG TPA: signal recognition particle-docking protein FtsY [Clostridia bacterium]|mgnify:CR=1 FL=1|jgi:fused signal recognition particle receptor|nr:signal recognition particle-docking protein FtsY [Clostridia bacterium]HOK81278.1 signal recognition particle-docking protein FtsY [Clostridia bacterium]HOL60397.1 signal recognition particle-docking protein FtsY [Clostridia bacterium]HPO53154.1 signal recognition particle-docking protein FtsY [Clostridia bacterium]